MADRKEPNTSKSDMMSSKREQGFRVQREPDGGQKRQPVVGRDTPDESKERHTEIAVEAGKMAGRAHKDDKKH